MGMIAVIPMFYFVRYFEDGAGFSAMTDSIGMYAAVMGAAVSLLFMVSMMISVAGYRRRR